MASVTAPRSGTVAVLLSLLTVIMREGQPPVADAADLLPADRHVSAEHAESGLNRPDTGQRVTEASDGRDATEEVLIPGDNQSVTVLSKHTGTTETISHVVINSFTDHGNTTLVTQLQTWTLFTAVSIPFTKPSVTYGQDGCDVMICEIGSRRFRVKTSACSENESPSIEVMTSTIVEIISGPTYTEKHTVCCQWIITKRTNHYTKVTVGQLGDEFHDNFTLEFKEVGRYDFLSHAVIDNAKLTKANFSFSSDRSVHVHFKIHEPQSTQVVTLYVEVKHGLYVRDLPVVMLSNKSGYVTSPGYDVHRVYPNNYNGDFQLNIAGNESVLIFMVQFDVSCRSPYGGDYLQFTHAAKRSNRQCSLERIPVVQVLRSSLHLLFHTDSKSQASGFKIFFAVVPRNQEPHQLSNKLFNCSGPGFHNLKPLFTCNKFRECEGGEDEQDCGDRDSLCGEGAIEAGTKCYTFLSLHQPSITSFDAHKHCLQRGQSPVTFIDLEEYRKFQMLIPPSPLIMYFMFYLGAQLMNRHSAVSIAALYRGIWRWVGRGTAFSIRIIGQHGLRGSCSAYKPADSTLKSFQCNRRRLHSAVVCEFRRGDEEIHKLVAKQVNNIGVDPAILFSNVIIVHCPSRHVTRDFLSCDAQADCNTQYPVTSCSAGGVTVPMFKCQESRSTVHYTLVCDHMQHCSDNSDEDFCKYPECSLFSLTCSNGQCIHASQRCDGKLDCYDGSDELCRPKVHNFKGASPPGSVYLDGSGTFHVHRMRASDDCPPTHFLCPRGFCLPVYLRCNAVDDCPGREDEAGCDSYECHGFYRCRGSKACLHADHVCDGVPQCPQQDDELLCGLDLTCPVQCRCQGLAFVCGSNFSAISYPALRYLDVSGSNMTLSEIRGNIHLIVLRMSKCLITSLLLNMTFPNLRLLDISWNILYQLHMQSFYYLTNLRHLVLSGNPLIQITNHGSASLILERVDLSHTNLIEFNGSVFANSPYIRVLNMSRSKLGTITEDGFSVMSRLEILDMTGCRLVNFSNTLLRNLTYLKFVQSENYKLCCTATLPVNFDPQNCHATQDLLSSCEDLLKSSVYRVFFWIVASLSLTGNVFLFVVRVFRQDEDEAKSSVSVFVANLSVADFFMGVYLAIIGTADLRYRGNYLWHDGDWKNSAACDAAGFLCLLSSEVSAFIICLITLDRFLVLRFPFSRLHFKRRSALAACAVVWALGIAVAIVRLLPVTSHFEFHSQTGICIPLPFTSGEFFRGYVYSFSVSILLNLVLFLFICVGQVVVFLAVRANSMQSSTNTRARDATIARRLITIAVSDFLCWFPIGVLGLLAYTGTPIPGELNVAVATFVLPVNSALNPFLYSFNIFMEKRRQVHYEMLWKRLALDADRQKITISHKPKRISEPPKKTAVIQQVKDWVGKQLLTQEDIQDCLTEHSLPPEIKT